LSRLYLLDSNVYIRAFRDAAFGAELQDSHRRARLEQRSFLHDMLIAATARELSATLVTDNVAA
jgi:predicted nucleic acid-binding protein